MRHRDLLHTLYRNCHHLLYKVFLVTDETSTFYRKRKSTDNIERNYITPGKETILANTLQKKICNLRRKMKI